MGAISIISIHLDGVNGRVMKYEFEEKGERDAKRGKELKKTTREDTDSFVSDSLRIKIKTNRKEEK